MLKDNWMPTVSGNRFWLNPIDVSQVTLHDIAFGLGRQGRFNGQWRYGVDWYSVAEHCNWASYLVPPYLALAAHVHDAHEALIGDMTSPLKAEIAEYCAYENQFERALAVHFGWHIQDMKNPLVKRADLQMLAIERTNLIAHLRTPFACLEGVPKPDATIKLQCWGPSMAAEVWLDRYKQLRGPMR